MRWIIEKMWKRRRSPLAASAFLSLCTVMAATVGHAQSVRGTVVDGADLPVPGVVVQLLDSRSREVSRVLSDNRGEFRLSANVPGTYSIRTLRIGFRPVASEPLLLATGATVTKRLVLNGAVFSLDTIRTISRGSDCKVVASDSAASTFVVWEQVRAALAATELTARTRTIIATTVAYERTLDPGLRRIREQTSDTRSDFVTQPWRSLPADSLRRTGYVVVDSTGAATYNAPGLDALLSDYFLQDHCLRLSPKSDSTRLGIEFEPTSKRRRSAEIAGTLWLRRATAELISMEFRYVNVTREQQSHAGGEMEFDRMKNGLWAISRWSIRMPVFTIGLTGPTLTRQELRVGAIRVIGGELVMALASTSRGHDTLWSRPRSVPAGTVVDSVPSAPTGQAILRGVVRTDSTDQPIPDAEVLLPELGLATRTDAAGTFALSGIPPGNHRLVVRRVGYGALDTRIDLAASQTLERRIVLGRIVTLDSLVRTERRRDPGMESFAENQKMGLGHFVTRAELAAREGSLLTSFLWQMPGVRIVSVGGEDWALSVSTPRSTCAKLGPVPAESVIPCLERERLFYIPSKDDRKSGLPIACHPRVYLDAQLLNQGSPAIPVNLRSFPPSQVEAMEFYSRVTQLPSKYQSDARCGVLVIHTRRPPG